MSNEVRKKWWTVPVGNLVWAFIAGVCSTLRKKIVNLNGPDDPWGDYQCIIALWHNRVFAPCHVYRYVVKGRLPMSMLTSASKDGAMLATVVKNYGMRAVRGSSRRRGVAGFLDMLRELNRPARIPPWAGGMLCVAPNPPKCSSCSPRRSCRSPPSIRCLHYTRYDKKRNRLPSNLRKIKNPPLIAQRGIGHVIRRKECANSRFPGFGRTRRTDC